MAHVGWRLSAEERLAWAEDGFFIRRRVFPEKELVALREAAERVVVRARGAAAQGGTGYEIDGNRYHEVEGATIQYEHDAGSDTVRVLEPFHHLDARLDRLVDDPRLVEPMRDLVGAERVSLFTDKLNLKRPREGSRFRWHQDSPYWAHFHAELDRLPNVMLALDDASEENGCLRIIRGSHKRAMLPGLEGQGRLGPLFTDPAHFDETHQVVAEMPAGSILFFSPHTVHGSEPNESSALRRALIFTYQPAGNRMFKIDAEREAVAA
jgi:hypothetical protein